MPKLPKRLRYELLILAALALGSCDQHIPKSERIEIADVNARNALAAIRELEARVEVLERAIR
jgi:hypothetical protein